MGCDDGVVTELEDNELMLVVVAVVVMPARLDGDVVRGWAVVGKVAVPIVPAWQDPCSQGA